MSFQPSDHIRTILNNLPLKPGVYLMKDARGTIIYVGKAKKLRNRVRSYFNASAESSLKTMRLRENIVDIDFIVEENEVKALILEETLIKRYKPRYNISLKDDKRYPYIKVLWHLPFPKVETTRRPTEDGSRYFGPYVAMWAVQNTLQTLRKAFPYLTCDREITGNDARACLFHDIKLCNAPCIGAVNQSQYRDMISELMDVLGGKSEAVVARLSNEMNSAAESLDFERAAAVRDQLKAIEYITRQHKAVTGDLSDRDVIAIARDKGDTLVQILFVRNGKLIGSDSRALDGTEGESDSEILEAFLKRFYSETAEVPSEVILPQNIEEVRIIERWLRDRRSGKRVTITVPQRGDKRQLLDIAHENAEEALKMMRAQWEADSHKQESALADLQQALELSRPPNRIECFDISTTQGTAIVASRVMFVQGVPKKNEYRRFNIRTVSHKGSDDYQSMREALTRRFNRWRDAVNEPVVPPPGQEDRDETWRLLPDLLMIDGGKGQLNVAVEVLREFDLLERVPVVSLAKQFEEIYRPGNPTPLILSRRSDALYLVQRIRDEAHRYAITSHRQQRNKLGLVSQLESVPGVGPAKRKALLKAFGNSIGAIRAASVEELSRVPGITPRLAETIKEMM
ncbi:MAG: excinuclease ABC subunit UvrC [Pleurocapsa minor GSE-CHR-MK-17-07R]|jgi:excinuclease ABC subunit C|nr:excinuclease ABC subunit UvrC [Pleurocapsa minor GSE-CHR-MK 17-07R]